MAKSFGTWLSRGNPRQHDGLAELQQWFKAHVEAEGERPSWYKTAAEVYWALKGEGALTDERHVWLWVAQRLFEENRQLSYDGPITLAPTDLASLRKNGKDIERVGFAYLSDSPSAK